MSVVHVGLFVKKKECKESCPLPLSLIPRVEKSINKIEYDEKSGRAVVYYDKSKISKEKIIAKLREIGYDVKKLIGTC